MRKYLAFRYELDDGTGKVFKRSINQQTGNLFPQEVYPEVVSHENSDYPDGFTGLVYGKQLIQLETGTYEIIVKRKSNYGGREVLNNTQVSFQSNGRFPTGEIVNIKDNFLAGGLRVKQQVQAPNSDSPPITTTYEYTIEDYEFLDEFGDLYDSELKKSSGVLVNYPVHETKEYRSAIFGGSDVQTVYELIYLAILQDSDYPIPLSTTSGSHIGYSQVIERQVGNGKTIQSFISPKEEGDVLPPSIYSHTVGASYTDNFEVEYIGSTANVPRRSMHLIPTESRDWRRGKPLETKIYNEAGVLLQLTRNTYLENAQITLPAYGVLSRNIWSSSFGSIGTTNKEIIFFPYFHKIAFHFTHEVVQTVYDQEGNNPVVTQSTHFHEGNNHNFLTKTRTRNSDSRMMEKRFKYPRDYDPGELFEGSGSLGIQTLLDQHIIATPIESQTWEGNSVGNLKMTDGQIQIFKNFATTGIPILRPYKTYIFETNSPREASEIQDQQNVQGLYENLAPNDISPFYTLRANFEYDGAFGNLIEQSLTDGTPISYRWNASGTRPLAQVVGASKEEVEGIAIDQLRLQLSGALVTTYTYDDRLLVETVTDPAGITTKI